MGLPSDWAWGEVVPYAQRAKEAKAAATEAEAAPPEKKKLQSQGRLYMPMENHKPKPREYGVYSMLGKPKRERTDGPNRWTSKGCPTTVPVPVPVPPPTAKPVTRLEARRAIRAMKEAMGKDKWQSMPKSARMNSARVQALTERGIAALPPVKPIGVKRDRTTVPLVLDSGSWAVNDVPYTSAMIRSQERQRVEKGFQLPTDYRTVNCLGAVHFSHYTDSLLQSASCYLLLAGSLYYLLLAGFADKRCTIQPGPSASCSV